MPITAAIYKQMLDNCAKDMQRDFDRIMLANNYIITNTTFDWDINFGYDAASHGVNLL